LEARVHRLEPAPGVTGLCAGYEQKEWRAKQLASHLMKWLPEFALKHTEVEALGAANAVELIARAAKTIYSSGRSANRGEFGELLLHVALRQCFKTLPAISKYFYKDSRNDTVKGFDAVHVVASADTLELWLGEVKFYADISRAIRDVVAPVEASRDAVEERTLAVPLTCFGESSTDRSHLASTPPQRRNGDPCSGVPSASSLSTDETGDADRGTR